MISWIVTLHCNGVFTDAQGRQTACHATAKAEVRGTLLEDGTVQGRVTLPAERGPDGRVIPGREWAQNGRGYCCPKHSR